jgi:F0F1-type ATP synthase membrane subunit b/b'
MSEVRITVLDQLDQLEDIVLDGSRIPFSGGRLVNEQDAIEVMDALRESLPSQITQADELIRQRDSFVEKARQQAEEIVSAARREREQLIATASIRHEAERQVAEMREQTRQQCEQLIGQARQQAAQTEQELQGRMAQLEQQFAVRRQQLEQEAQTRRQQLEGEAAERNRVLVEQHERGRQQAMQELETIRQEGLRVQRDSQVEAERLHNDALQFRQQTQQQCDALIARSRQEAATIQEGANRYAEQVLGELEGRLKELSQVVLGGRRELVRMQNPEATANGAVVPLAEAANGMPQQLEPVSRARRAAGRLRRATRGLAS